VPEAPAFRVALVVGLLALAVRSEAAGASCGERAVIGEIVSIENGVDIVGPTEDVEVRHLDGEAVVGEEERRLCLGDEVRVGDTGRVTLRLYELNSVIRLDASTVFALGGVVPSESPTAPNTFAEASSTAAGEGALGYCLRTFERAWLTLRSGALRLFTTRPQRLNVRTPYLNASVEGTEFSMRVDGEVARVQTTEGVVALCNAVDGARPVRARPPSRGETTSRSSSGPTTRSSGLCTTPPSTLAMPSRLAPEPRSSCFAPGGSTSYSRPSRAAWTPSTSRCARSSR